MSAIQSRKQFIVYVAVSLMQLVVGTDIYIILRIYVQKKVLPLLLKSAEVKQVTITLCC